MRALIIKTSSMGDVLHTLPALTDAGRALGSIHFDWLVENSFADIPRWHPLVENIIPVSVRSWRKKLFARETWREINMLRQTLGQQKYDCIIDAQGLIKSAALTLFTRGPAWGLDRHSARESLAAFFYKNKISVEKKQHAITRIRQLFAAALNYTMPDTPADSGINRESLLTEKPDTDYLVFLHGTTWVTKYWPDDYWITLAEIAAKNNFKIKIGWGNTEEHARAKKLALRGENIEVLPARTISDMACVLAGAKGVVAVDTGLGHLTAALGVPCVSLYGPTSAILTGAFGAQQTHLSSDFTCAPCFSRTCHLRDRASDENAPSCMVKLTPERVWNALETQMGTHHRLTKAPF